MQKKFSFGKRKGLCILQTVSLGPEVILMDEPCSAIGQVSTNTVEALITILKKEYTIVIVVHNMQKGQRIFDQVAFMFLGELIEYNT